jgi:hypothetical protein
MLVSMSLRKVFLYVQKYTAYCAAQSASEEKWILVLRSSQPTFRTDGIVGLALGCDI